MRAHRTVQVKCDHCVSADDCVLLRWSSAGLQQPQMSSMCGDKTENMRFMSFSRKNEDLIIITLINMVFIDLELSGCF